MANIKHKIMKTLVTTIIAVIISLSAFSQTTESGDINKKFYIRGGLSYPTWKYYGYENANALKAGIGAESRIGGIFEIGAIFMLNGINVGPDMRFGINVDFVSFKTQIFNLPGSENLYNLFVGSKIGPSFTYAPTRALAFDVFAKLNPVWVGATYLNHQNFDNGLDVYYGYVQMMYSVGINIDLAVIYLGFEYDFGGLKLKNNDGMYFDPLRPGLEPGDDPLNPELKPQMGATKVPMHGFNVTFGFNF